MYIVNTLHETGHGPRCNVILITADPRLAIETARNAESLEYQYYSNGTPTIAITKQEVGKIYHKKESYNYVFIRRHSTFINGEPNNPHWEEEWYDEEVAKMFDGQVRIAAE